MCARRSVVARTGHRLRGDMTSHIAAEQAGSSSWYRRRSDERSWLVVGTHRNRLLPWDKRNHNNCAQNRLIRRRVERDSACICICMLIYTERLFPQRCWARFIVCLAQIERRVRVCNSGWCTAVMWCDLHPVLTARGPSSPDAVGKYSFLLQTCRYDVSPTVKWLPQTKTCPDNVVRLVASLVGNLTKADKSGPVVKAMSPNRLTQRKLDHD